MTPMLSAQVGHSSPLPVRIHTHTHTHTHTHACSFANTRMHCRIVFNYTHPYILCHPHYPLTIFPSIPPWYRRRQMTLNSWNSARTQQLYAHLLPTHARFNWLFLGRWNAFALPMRLRPTRTVRHPTVFSCSPFAPAVGLRVMRMVLSRPSRPEGTRERRRRRACFHGERARQINSDQFSFHHY